MQKNLKNLIIIEHPLVKRDLTLLRDRRTPSFQFRAILRHLAGLMAYEVTKDLKIEKIDIHTPLEKTFGYKIIEEVILVPILRAGLGMVGGFVEYLPDARVGHIGLYRDEETLKPVDYYFKFPKKLKDSLILVLDPMLATGGSASAAIAFLKNKGARNIRFVSIVASPQGVRTLNKAHPEVRIYTTALDRTLNSKGYILPGLGDAGDRIFGTGD
ncbi:MAG: Uracil phosphoribosyltransferase [Ignavibacteriae bacterium]|nr:MAG: Uracil phosphoribosyltransferase [Ignavibacteriota bacterium]